MRHFEAEASFAAPPTSARAHRTIPPVQSASERWGCGASRICPAATRCKRGRQRRVLHSSSKCVEPYCGDCRTRRHCHKPAQRDRFRGTICHRCAFYSRVQIATLLLVTVSHDCAICCCLAASKPQLNKRCGAGAVLCNKQHDCGIMCAGCITDAQQANGGAAGRIDFGADGGIVLNLSGTATLPELRKHKRGFIKLATQNAISIRDSEQATQLFVAYLRSQPA